MPLNEKPAVPGGFLFSPVSPDLTELRECLDQPERNALKPAGQECDAGDHEKHADGLLDPPELLTHMAGRADERADRRGGEDEGQP